MSSIYETGEYLEKNPTWFVEDSPWKAKYVLKAMCSVVKDIRTVCEVGCGAGEILSQLYKQLPQDKTYVGYEISPQAFALCRERENEKVKFYHLDLLKDNSAHFDIVLAIDVFEHVEDYFGFLRGIRAKGNYKIFHIPLDLSVLSVLRNWLIGARESAGHIHYFTKETAIATLCDTGYEVIECFYTPAAVELSNQGFKAKLLRWPRKCAFALHPDWAVRVLGGYSLMVLAK